MESTAKARFLKAIIGLSLLFGLFQAEPVLAAPGPVATNDTFINRQWYLDQIQAREGWAMATGTANVIVAVIDSGVDVDHPDLKPNLWSNPGELANNGKDDDGDGYVDDVHGWNFINRSADVRPIASQDGLREAWMHGTAVASLIAAAGNNDIGISGVAWNARIMPLVVLGSDGYGKDEDIVAAIRYAVAHGADIINLSFVGGDFDPDLEQAISEATSQGVLVVSAAGNSEKIAGDNMDLSPGYPACDKGAAGRGVLTVSALTKGDQRAVYANYGTCVDVSAPGENLFAARPTRDQRSGAQVAGYVDNLTGTSVAAPLVSGLAALLKAEHPSWTAVELATRIMDTADPLTGLPAELKGKMGRGRINVARALQDDAKARGLGPLFLEGSAAGHPPEVRILDHNNNELERFFVGDTGDRRGIRATFIRWSGNQNPEVAVTAIGDQTGAWRVYRTDGALVAAGSVASDVKGGLYLAAQDLDYSGHDTLFMGEAGGPRAWLVSAKNRKQDPIQPFAASTTHGISALSVARPVPGFLVASRYDGGQIAVIGQDGIKLAWSQVKSKPSSHSWLNRRATTKQGGQVFDRVSADGRLVFVSDAAGLRLSKDTVQVDRWVQVPDGELQPTGWLYYETWPR